jgi:hypothetical protein
MDGLTQEYINAVLLGSVRRPNYKLTVDLAKKIAVHADGIVPERLIFKRRPSESEKIKDYRKEIYIPKTKNPISKVLNSLGKIRRSADWAVRYDKNKVPSVLSDNTLEQYCEYNYPGFTSISNWVFTELLKRYLIDANSLVAIVPESIPSDSTEYLNPIALLFSSEQILDYEEGHYAILKSNEITSYKSANGARSYMGGVYYVLTDTYIIRYEQGLNKSLIESYNYGHNLGYLPVFNVKGLYLSYVNGGIVYESRISPMVPELDEAAREYSDLQAEVVQHIHSEKYIYTNTECAVCKGTGTAKDSAGMHSCPNCNGTGSVLSTSPYGVHIIQAQRKLEEYELPTPPIGYVQKDVEIVKIQDERVRQHIYAALAAINMEFLAEVPLAQSGIAKEVDRDELNNFVSYIAEDIVAVMDSIYKGICDLRYSVAVSDAGKRDAMLPVVNVPERFDLLSANMLMAEISAMKQNNVDPLIVRSVELDYIKKKFNADPDIGNKLEAVLDLNPLPGLSADEKMSYYAEGVIREVDYVISANIERFVRTAIERDSHFFSKTYEDKLQVLEELANAVIEENSAKAQIQSLQPVFDGQESPVGS